MDIKFPVSKRRKALFVIDVQPLTLSDGAKALIPLMTKFIEATDYDAYVEASYFADEQSMFYRQGGFLKPKSQIDTTAPEVLKALTVKTVPRIRVEKNTRSCFKAFNANELSLFLLHNEIEEAHFIGYDINDCVLASVYDAIDLGYFSYVITELCDHWEGNRSLKDAAMVILQRQGFIVSDGDPFAVVSV